jgi:glycosyltransferase involved in cell wall biosynthesis
MKILISKPMSFPEAIEFPQGSELLLEDRKLSWHFERKWPKFKIGARLGRIYLARELFKRRRDFDLIITGMYGEYFALLQGLIKYRRKPHLLLDIEWYEKRRSILLTLAKKFMNKLIARGAYRISVFCQVEIENYSNYYGIDRNKFIWIPFCIDMDETELGVEENNYIFTGGMIQRDYETLFNAVKDIPINIMIAAPKDAISKKNISGNMVLMGVVDSKEYYSAMAKSKLVVLSLEPDIRRGQGVKTYVSAMRLGKAVIVNETEGARSYVVDGKTGLIVPPRDPIALKNAIEKLLYNDELRREISKNAYEYAKENFSTDRLTKELKKWMV